MIFYRFLLRYLFTYVSEARVRARVRANKCPKKGGFGEPLFLVRALDRLPASLSSIGFAEKFSQRF